MCRPERLPGKLIVNGQPEVTLPRNEPRVIDTIASFIGLIRVFLLVKSAAAALKHIHARFLLSSHITAPFSAVEDFHSGRS